jgi:hypothetical protein
MPNAMICPHCQKADFVIRYGYTSAQMPRAKCKACNKTFGVTLQPIEGDEKRTLDLVRRHKHQLKRIREKWCRRPRSKRPVIDRTSITVILDGSRVLDIPTFHIALGEAVNGPGGYYGGDLGALDDCLRGRFGLIPPFVLEIIGLEHVRETIESTEKVWRQWQHFCWKRDYPEDFEENEAFVAAIMRGEIEDIEDKYANYSYFEMILRILTERGVTVREHVSA